MNILISNDDGINSPGILALAKVLSDMAAITVVAPDRDRSGASNSLTLARPLQIKQLKQGFYSVDGTPTDCVHLALTGMLDTQFDMVIAGINAGENLGDDVLYSGTVAAAMEGRFLGLPAIAFSLVGKKIRHYQTAAYIAKKLIMRINSGYFPNQTIFNVNIPDVPLSEIKGMSITRLGKRHKSEPAVKTYNPRGVEIYWIGAPGNTADAGMGTDFYAVSKNYVSVTPLQIDLTNYVVMDKLSAWLKKADLTY